MRVLSRAGPLNASVFGPNRMIRAPDRAEAGLELSRGCFGRRHGAPDNGSAMQHEHSGESSQHHGTLIVHALGLVRAASRMPDGKEKRRLYWLFFVIAH